MLIARMIRSLEGTVLPSVVCLDDTGELAEILQDEGVPVICVHRRPGIDCVLPSRLARVFRQLKPDIVHAQQYTPTMYAGAAMALLRNRPALIFTEHGRHWPDVVSWKRQAFNRLFLNRIIDACTAVCQYSADAIRNNENLRRRVEIIPNGVDIDAFRKLRKPRDELCRAAMLDSTRRYVLCVARFHPVKGHHTLVAAFAHVSRQFPDVDLLLAGEGPERAALERRVRDTGLSQRVHFLGVRKDVTRLMSLSQAFCMTSVNEAASLTVLEAMACELPVVLTDVGGNGEIVRHNIDGLLVPRSDVEACARSLGHLLEHSRQAREMGLSGRQRVATEFSFDTMVSRYRELYTRLSSSGNIG